jgi:hypothetical protein
MNKQEIIEKIIMKKEFSQLPKEDIEKAFSKFDKPSYLDEEKVKLTRDLLRKTFSAFTSQKILLPREKSAEWVLKKHFSTRERFSEYSRIYSRLLKKFNRKINLFDLGAGINGFSYPFFKNSKVNYFGIEAIGQLVESTNAYFKKEKINGKTFHKSLFNLDFVSKLIKSSKGTKVIFLFKTIDSLENLENNYSKKLISTLLPLVDLFVVSFATKSLVKRSSFYANRNWIFSFIRENFKILDDFEVNGERYISFENKKIKN